MPYTAENYSDEEMNKLTEGPKSEGNDAEQAVMKGPKGGAVTPSTMPSKSSEALKILGAGTPYDYSKTC